MRPEGLPTPPYWRRLSVEGSSLARLFLSSLFVRRAHACFFPAARCFPPLWSRFSFVALHPASFFSRPSPGSGTLYFFVAYSLSFGVPLLSEELLTGPPA